MGDGPHRVGTAEARLREKTGAAGSQLIAGPAPDRCAGEIRARSVALNAFPGQVPSRYPRAGDERSVGQAPGHFTAGRIVVPPPWSTRAAGTQSLGALWGAALIRAFEIVRYVGAADRRPGSGAQMDPGPRALARRDGPIPTRPSAGAAPRPSRRSASGRSSSGCVSGGCKRP